MKAVGITCGIGSMLVGARAAGFKVVGNVEWRKYYHEKDANGHNTFTVNFPDAIFPNSLEQMSEEEFQRFSNADLALGHPECGNFSQLSGANKNRQEKLLDPADIPLFVEIVAKLKPRFFVMDDLPKSFMAYPMAKYHEKLPEYDLFPEWVSNWGYGNVQKGRNRMFMLGALKTEGWTFVPGEAEHSRTVFDVIGDLPTPRAQSNVPNQDPFDHELDCFRALNLGGFRKKSTWGQVQEYFRDKPGGFTLEYPTKTGEMVKRIGFLKGHWTKTSHVLTGGNAILHNQRCEPYTIRERARIQGFPDDFVFYGAVLNDRGEWNHDTNMHMVKQTGKAMPVQFCQYVSDQIACQIEGRGFFSTGKRVILPNDFVSEAKKWYCSNVGYAQQGKACDQCWLARTCSIRVEKYGFSPMSRYPGEALAQPASSSVGRQKAPKPKTEVPAAASKEVATAGVSALSALSAPVITRTMSFRGERK